MAGAEPPSRDAGSDDLHIRTFLIADVRGWTVFTQEHGDEGAGKLAAKFARLVREVVEGRGGKLLELRGDEAMCVFGSPRQAIRAAADLQVRFVEETLADPELPLTVGIGLDAGEAVEVEGGYRGGALNLAARLCSQAVAGEILASREVAHLARRVEGVTYLDRGSISLKGLSEPVGFVKVVPEGEDPVERLSPYAPVRAPEPRRRRRPPWPALVAAALAVILVAVGLPLLISGDDEIVPEANSIARLDPADGSIDLATQLDARPGATAAGFDSIWVVHPDRGYVSRLAVVDGRVKDTIQIGGTPAGIAIGEGSVWVTNTADGTVSRISPDTNEETQKYEVGSGPSGIAVGGGALWVADSVANELVRVNLPSGRSRTVALPAGPTAVRFTSDGVWVASAGAATVTRVDPDSLEVTVQVPVGNGPAAIVSAFGSVWVANRLDGNVSRIEPSTGQILATVPVGDGPNSVVEAVGQVWVANEFTNDIVSLDPASDPIGLRERVNLGAVVGSMVSTPDGVWVSVGASATSHRGGTLNVVSPDTIDSLDPGVAYGPEWIALSLTNDGLIGYRKTGGAEGLDLVPDLAAALPDVSADGLRYRFPLRDQQVRYSTGDPVKPEDFRYGLERAIKLTPAAASLFSALPGALECSEKPDRCDLGESIVTDADAVTLHLAVPDPDFLFKLALPFASPVPVGTPIEDQGIVPVPATGPYVITEASEKHLVLERNPYFEEWSPAAQPNGFVDRIEWAIRPELEVPLHDVVRGETDAVWGHLPPDGVAELRTTHPDQLIQVADPAAYYWLFDLATPPFDDPRVRRAINLAVDRTRVQELLGGESVWRVSCQIMPPNFPGYEPYCPYTLNPGAAWTGADLDEARRLIEEAGAGGAPVSLRASGDPFTPGANDVARYLEDLLDRLGFEATLEFLDIDPYFLSIEPNVHRGVQMFEYIWFPDFPAASGFISLLYRCGAAVNVQPFCDREFDRAMAEAQRLAPTDPAAANAAWAALDRELVDRAVSLPLVNSVRSYAFSDRVGNAQINPQFGLLLSRLWVR